jgi:hypothetical protein
VGGEVKGFLQNMHDNLSHLTQWIPMVQVEDLPKAMQRQVVGIPRAWVRIFQNLTSAVVFYHDMHLAPHA